MRIGHTPLVKTGYLIGALYIMHQSDTLFYGKGRGLFAYREETDSGVILIGSRAWYEYILTLTYPYIYS